ncbi:transposase [Streptomyces sp. NPDC005202]|uniref:transposase n=1 Tax=Streptomyces sp. NPDC005202 TaxID=3157021 RepID=UPI0033B0F4DA
MDEFALRKGHNYGTILVDIDTRRPVDLLPDRATATVARWLADHPGVEMICRDRSTAYAEPGPLGAPDAVHVADRWHLWKNLAEAVEKTVIPYRALLRQPEVAAPVRTGVPLETTGLAPESPAEPRPSGRLSDRVREQHAAVHALLDEGLELRPIARQLGLARNTVRRLAHAATADELLVGRWTGRTSILDPYKPYLHQRWAVSCPRWSVISPRERTRGSSSSTAAAARPHQLDPAVLGPVRQLADQLVVQSIRCPDSLHSLDGLSRDGHVCHQVSLPFEDPPLTVQTPHRRTDVITMAPTSACAKANGLEMYYEVRGVGPTRRHACGACRHTVGSGPGQRGLTTTAPLALLSRSAAPSRGRPSGSPQGRTVTVGRQR